MIYLIMEADAPDDFTINDSSSLTPSALLLLYFCKCASSALSQGILSLMSFSHTFGGSGAF
nr:hypothetical protein [Gooseberry vein banding associated virus]